MTAKQRLDLPLKLTLNESGKRLTQQRLEILDYLRGVTTHPTSEMIYTALKKKLPYLSLATVYRNVNYLASEKMILEIKGEDGKMHFDGNNLAHIHFICKQCQKIYDIWTKKAPQFAKIDEVAQIDRIDCTIYGLCKKCKK
ncbi:MAG: Ferric uptake regulator, Fur family [Parcubacteria group bacterium GW2011_GWC2_38_7]|nr:MAG: Ferric uptake regulator, Fur family [Parcubacteria group bacterium GW2011_GWC2_38_7]